MKDITPIEKVKVPPQKPKINIQQLSSDAPKRGTFLFYGASGAGKTTLAGTFPKPFFVDMRAGLVAIRHRKVAYTRPRNFVDMLLPACPEIVEPFETIVFDQLTEAHRLLMVQALAMSQREKPQLQDWQLTIERLRRIIVAYTNDDTPILNEKHIVFIAEEHLEKNEDTGTIFWLPDVPGKFATQIEQFFDCVFHLRLGYNAKTQTKGRWMLTEPDGMYPQAKNRLGGLDKLEEPDFGTMWKKIVEVKQ